VINISYDGEHTTSAEKIKSFIKMLDALKPGNTYLFVDHPGSQFTRNAGHSSHRL
jgi:hypothetical protein